jgi:hypothetical protein
MESAAEVCAADIKGKAFLEKCHVITYGMIMPTCCRPWPLLQRHVMQPWHAACVHHSLLANLLADLAVQLRLLGVSLALKDVCITGVNQPAGNGG